MISRRRYESTLRLYAAALKKLNLAVAAVEEASVGIGAAGDEFVNPASNMVRDLGEQVRSLASFLAEFEYGAQVEDPR